MTIISHETTQDHFPQIQALSPGLGLAAALAAAAFGLRAVPGISVLSPMILSILLGIVFHNMLGTPARAKAGVTFALRHVLRFAIILLGLQLTVQQVKEAGWMAVAIIAVSLTATFMMTKFLGRLLGVERRLAELIAAGTSVCGASAVVAVNTVTGAKDEDVAYAIACVTVFGSVAMFLYPLLPGLLGLSPHQFGLWSGTSIHEIAQVIAASFQDGHSAGEFGTIAKLTRVSMLAPLIFALGAMASRRRRSGQSKAPLPWFILGFAALVVVNSLGIVPATSKAAIATTTTFLLSTALAAMGLETDLKKLAMRGSRPALLGALSALFISGFSLSLIKLLG